MGFDIYEEIAFCQKVLNDIDGLKETIDSQYKISYTLNHIKCNLNSRAYYYSMMKQFEQAVSCLSISLYYDNSQFNTNRIKDCLNLINTLSGEEWFLTSPDDAINLMIKEGIPFKPSKEMMTAYCDLYQKTLLDKSIDEKTVNKVRQNLIEMTGDEIIAEIVETDVKKNLVLYPLKNYNFKLYIPKFFIQKKLSSNFENINTDKVILTFSCNNCKVNIGVLNQSQTKLSLTEKQMQLFILYLKI